jgi:hypothetical protein
MNMYMIPGLGADKRMYTSQLRVFPHAQVLEHLAPVKGQTLREYAHRFIPLIDTTQPFILLGTSLGGMVSVELAHVLNPEKVILLASVKNRNELPYFIRAMRYLKLHKPIPGSAYIRLNNLLGNRLAGRGEGKIAKLIVEMAADCNPAFIEWAVDAVIHWQPPVEYPKNIIHLHGTADMLFPYSRIANGIAVKNGSHVMNISIPAEVNRLLLEAIEK